MTLILFDFESDFLKLLINKDLLSIVMHFFFVWKFDLSPRHWRMGQSVCQNISFEK